MLVSIDATLAHVSFPFMGKGACVLFSEIPKRQYRCGCPVLFALLWRKGGVRRMSHRSPGSRE